MDSTPRTFPRANVNKTIPAFLQKLYNMVDDKASDRLIRWSVDGASFIVDKQEEFARDVLPRFFKHNNFSSFIRQLNMYGFHKVPNLQQGVLKPDMDGETLQYSNPNFIRGQPDLLYLVTRRKGRDAEERDAAAVAAATLASAKGAMDTSMDLSGLLNEIQSIKKHQQALSHEIKVIQEGYQQENQTLWQQLHRQQQTVDKILRFLASVFSSEKTRRTVATPRKRLMIEHPSPDATEGPSVRAKPSTRNPLGTEAGTSGLSFGSNLPSSALHGGEHQYPTFDFGSLNLPSLVNTGMFPEGNGMPVEPSLAEAIMGQGAFEEPVNASESAANTSMHTPNTLADIPSPRIGHRRSSSASASTSSNTTSLSRNRSYNNMFPAASQASASAARKAEEIQAGLDRLQGNINSLASQHNIDDLMDLEFDYPHMDDLLSDLTGPTGPADGDPASLMSLFAENVPSAQAPSQS